jgi:hypothetical protein
MHQIAKINHCETSILGRNGTAVKFTNAVATGISEERLAIRIPRNRLSSGLSSGKKPAGLLCYSLRPEQRQELALGHIKVMFANYGAAFKAR